MDLLLPLMRGKTYIFIRAVLILGVKTLSENQEVEYEIGETDRGTVANNVTPQ